MIGASGGHSIATGYRLYGVLGQTGPVGFAQSSEYRLEAGFLHVPGGNYTVYLPLVLRD